MPCRIEPDAHVIRTVTEASGLAHPDKQAAVWVAKRHRVQGWLRRHRGQLYGALSLWTALVFGTAATLVAMAGVTGPYLALGFAAAYVTGCILIALVFGVLALVMTRELPQAWARLRRCDGKLTQYVVTDDGAPEAHVIPELKKELRLPAPEAPGTSMAMSPEGSIIATIIRYELRIWTVDPTDGAVKAWTNPIPIDAAKHKNPRVVAVARCGELYVWCAYHFETPKGVPEVSWARLAAVGAIDKFMTVGREHEVGKGAYAAFVGDRLRYINTDEDALHEILCGRAYSEGQDPDGRLVRQNLINTSVKSIDAAVVGGRTYVALLIDVADGHGETITKLLVEPEGLAPAACTVERGSSHISLLRAPCGDAARATVFLVVGRSAIAYDCECEGATARVSKRRKGQRNAAMAGAQR